ncbi:MAG: copper amine oxidase N-terminal domain-containing protein [Clostridia bacterium]|nr:copper amine oxidase N-terminal domain-containing protein [Clostridia bacterium]
MKKFISLILALSMLMSFACIVSADETNVPEKVEISFKVGDSTLMINGAPVTVETPYIAGAGTTLVPLRVITEAFGAKVTWVGETKEIILEYPDVNIKLQIGNINAVVNDHTETLPEAPVLSPNGVTMVPLRFISETFGATVGYDKATAAITVVKEVSSENNTISSSTDLPRIGDSYYGWSMMTPSGMMMTDVSSDGTGVVFEDEEAVVVVEHFDFTDEKYGETGKDVFTQYYNDVKKKYFTSFTLSKDEKKSDENGNGYLRITGRTKEYNIDYYSFVMDRKCVAVCSMSPTGYENAASLTAVVDSFKFKFAANEEEKAQTYDLSTVDENGYRLVNNEDLKVSFKVPATCLSVDLEQLNIMYFVSGEIGNCTDIALGVYTKSENTTAKACADKDRTNNAAKYNKEFVAVSDVHPFTSAELGENAYYYWYTTDGLFSGDREMYDIFFEKGDYVYNISITVPEGKKDIFQTVILSLTTQELDSDEVGVFLREEIDYETTFVSSCSAWSMKIPDSWEALVEPTADAALYSSKTSESALIMQAVDADGIGYNQMWDFVELYEDQLKSTGEVYKSTTTEKIGGTTYYTFTIYSEDADADAALYSSAYLTLEDGKIYMFVATYDQMYANARAQEEVESMLASFKVK